MAGPGTEDEREPSRGWTLGLLALATVATLVIKVLVAAPRDAVGHGDIAHYVTLARNLVGGEGMWVDYVATWLASPTSTHSYGAGYWMPMPAWLGALGMGASGSDSVLAGSYVLIALTSVAPLLAYAVGRDLFGSRRSGLAAAVLAACFHLFVDKATLPLTHGCVLVFGGTALWATARSVGDRRFLWLAGAMAALAQMSRSDGILWVPTIVLVHLTAPREQRRLVDLWRAAVAYAAVLGPFLVYNASAIGSPWPGSLLSASLLTTYPDLYSLPERLTVERFLDQGVGTIAAQKGSAVLANLTTFATGLASGGGSKGAEKLATYVPHVCVGLAWLGALPLFSRRFLVLWFYVAAQLALYSLLFTFTGQTSFRPIMYALYPAFLVAVVRGVQLVVRLLTPDRRPRLRVALLAVVVIGLGAANVFEGARSAAIRARGNERGEEFSRELVQKLVKRHGLEGETFLVAQNVVHRFHAHTGLPAASIPYYATLDQIHAAARQVGATHLIVDDPAPTPSGWTALARLSESELFERVGAASIRGQGRVVYRVVP